MAAIPEEQVKQPMPPSISASLRSKAEDVGFAILE
jgi:hypothetical protein